MTNDDNVLPFLHDITMKDAQDLKKNAYPREKVAKRRQVQCENYNERAGVGSISFDACAPEGCKQASFITKNRPMVEIPS